jgi:hypothetical protein
MAHFLCDREGGLEFIPSEISYSGVYHVPVPMAVPFSAGKIQQFTPKPPAGPQLVTKIP